MKRKRRFWAAFVLVARARGDHVQHWCNMGAYPTTNMCGPRVGVNLVDQAVIPGVQEVLKCEGRVCSLQLCKPGQGFVKQGLA